MTEAQLQKAVMDAAKFYGWLGAHFRPSQTKSGSWATAMQGDIGFPDIVLVRAPRVLFVELKSEKGKLSDAQEVWRSALEDCEHDAQAHMMTGQCRPGYFAPIEYRLWRPDDWTNGEIQRVLKR